MDPAFIFTAAAAFRLCSAEAEEAAAAATAAMEDTLLLI